MDRVADIIQRIIEAGANTRVVAIVIEAIADMDCLRKSEDVLGRRRKADRLRKRKSRASVCKTTSIAEANDAAKRPRNSEDGNTVPLLPCDSSLPFFTSEEGNQDSKGSKRVVTRARGKRISSNAVMSEKDREFALSEGVSDPDKAWAEFIDYWSAVPGHRGVKLDWSATWRNRVRTVISRNGGSNGYAPRTGLQSALDKARKFARSGDPRGRSVPKDDIGKRR